MKNNARAAAAVGIGYLLGRHRRFRSATVMAAAMAVGGTPIGGRLLRKGLQMAGPADLTGKLSPQLGDIAEIMRNDLLTAGKAAATAALTNRVDSLADSIHERAERVRTPADLLTGDDDEESGEPRGEDEPRGESDEPPVDDEPSADDEPGGEDDEDAPPVRRTSTRGRSPVTRGSQARGSQARGSQARGGRPRAGRAGR